MERKIYKKQNKSKRKRDLKFFYCYWWLRSVSNDSCDYFSGFVNFYGYIDYIRSYRIYGVFPVCTI